MMFLKDPCTTSVSDLPSEGSFGCSIIDRVVSLRDLGPLFHHFSSLHPLSGQSPSLGRMRRCLLRLHGPSNLFAVVSLLYLAVDVCSQVLEVVLVFSWEIAPLAPSNKFCRHLYKQVQLFYSNVVG